MHIISDLYPKYYNRVKYLYTTLQKILNRVVKLAANQSHHYQFRHLLLIRNYIDLKRFI